ncbi:MAG: hypothetical protein LC793_13235 [Thermomicrobia bacterium]|nr:hypothetical protein [Thermomicrobia bacterium]
MMIDNAPHPADRLIHDLIAHSRAAMEFTLPADDERAAKGRELHALVERHRTLLERMGSGPRRSWN